MRTIDKNTGERVDTTRRLKALHRARSARAAPADRVGLREFARTLAGGPADDEEAGYARSWLRDKRATDHPRRARSIGLIESRAARRRSRRAKGNPKRKKAK